MVVVSTTLPWVHVVLLGDYNLFALYDAIGRSQTVPAILILASVLVAVINLVGVRGHAVAALALGIVALVRGLPELRHAEHQLRLLNPLVTRGSGPVLFVAGLIVLISGAVAGLSGALLQRATTPSR